MFLIVLADVAYVSDIIRHRVKLMWVKAKANCKVERRCVESRYKHRNVVKWFFDALKRFRRIATRYEKNHQIRLLRLARSPASKAVLNVRGPWCA